MRARAAHRSTTGRPMRTTAAALALLVASTAVATAALPPDAGALLEEAAAILPCLKLGPYTAVWEVQGSGHESPFVGETVDDLLGVVTADFQRGTGGPYEPRGFFLQAHEPDCDDATSDGVFVFTGGSALDVEVGDLVTVSGGLVIEYRGPPYYRWGLSLTEVVCTSGCGVTVLLPGFPLPAALDFAPPADEEASLAYHEAREGMVVTVAEDATVVAAPNRFNELSVLRGADRDRPHREDGPHGDVVVVDADGVAAANCGADGFGDVRTFDVVRHDLANGSAILGPLTYNFNRYKVQQDDDRACAAAEAGERASWDPFANPAPATDASSLTIATLNAYNLFDDANDPEKGDPVVSRASYDRRVAKIARAVCDPAALNRPLVVALQEVENAAVLARLVHAIRADCGVPYAYATAGAPDDRSIENAFLTREDRVRVVSATARQGCSERDWGVDYESGDAPPDVTCSGGTPHYLHARPPLHLVAEVDAGDYTRVVHAFGNHFKSKLGSSRCDEADCGDWRIEEAAHVAELVRDVLSDDPGALVAVVGDLNDYYRSATLDRLVKPDGPLTSAWDEVPGPPSTGQGSIRRYSYSHDGVSQVLDHHLASDALIALAHETSPRRISVDWPALYADRADTFIGVSDHDPLVVAYRLE